MSEVDPQQYPPSDDELTDEALAGIDDDSEAHEEAKEAEQAAEDAAPEAPDG